MRPLHRRTAAARAGFSLIEVMIVTMIMGMLFVGISQLMSLARKTRDNIHNFQETQLAGPAILEMITADLYAIQITGRERASWLEVVDRTINGLDADRIDFVTNTDSLVVTPSRDPDEDPLRADQNEVGYMLRESEENDEFLELWRREDLGVDDQPFREGSYTFLSNQIKGFNIEVYDEDGPEAEPIDEWGPRSGEEENVGLPVFLKITLTIELKPRINVESMSPGSVGKRLVDYVRIVRFPERLRFEEGSIPRIGLPPGVAQSSAGGGAEGEADDTENGQGNGQGNGNNNGLPPVESSDGGRRGKGGG